MILGAETILLLQDKLVALKDEFAKNQQTVLSRELQRSELDNKWQDLQGQLTSAKRTLQSAQLGLDNTEQRRQHVMTRLERITDILQTSLAPTHLEVADDSHKHAGHAGARPSGETHYSVVIESAKLQGMTKVQMHQRIYALLDTELKNGLHALAIQASASK